MEEAKTGQEHLEVTGIPSATTPYAISHLPDRVAHEQDFASHLPAEHRDYLQRRHGTLNLEPLPSGDEADPLNWPAWKKNVGLILVAFHAYIAIFTAATIIPAYLPMSIALHVSLTRTSYLTSAQIVVLGVSPLFWKPISNRYGRRPIFLISTFFSAICNIGCAESPNYGAMMVCRILVAFFISPPIGIGTAVVTELFFKRERAQKMGIWTLMVTLGPASGPFLMGFVSYHKNWHWIYWILVVTNAVQFILYIFFFPETRYLRACPHNKSAFQQEYLTFGRIDPEPLRFYDFYQPILLAGKASIVIPAVSYAIVFGFASVLNTVEIPQLFAATFDFNPQEIGLQFIALIVGSVLGELLGGPISDLTMNRRARALGHRPAPEYRLWSSYLGFLTAIIGQIVFLIQLNNIGKHYNVTPTLGVGIAAFGNQVVTTVLVTYAVDSHSSLSASIGVFITLVRQIWGFIGPFWFPYMFNSAGLKGSTGIVVAIIIAVAVLPVTLLQWKGYEWREGKREQSEDGKRE